MASAAYSTPARVQSRSLATPSRHAASELLDGRGCILLEGAMVTFQAGRRAYPGDRVLVVSHEGRVEVRIAGEAFSQPRIGFVYVEGDKSLPIGRRGLDLVPLIGALI